MMQLGPYSLDDVYCGDSAVMLAALPDACVDMTCTSPPYDSLRAYNGFSWDFDAIATQLYRVTKPGGVGRGGVCGVAVGYAAVGGEMKGITLNQDEVKQLQDSGAVAVWRDVNPQPETDTPGLTGWSWERRDGKRIPNGPRAAAGGDVNYLGVSIARYCPYATPGEVRFVRETWSCVGAEHVKPSEIAPGYTVYYAMDDICDNWRVNKWRASTTMPEWASRYTVTCSAVTVEKRGDVWAWGISLEMVQR